MPGVLSRDGDKEADRRREAGRDSAENAADAAEALYALAVTPEETN